MIADIKWRLNCDLLKEEGYIDVVFYYEINGEEKYVDGDYHIWSERGKREPWDFDKDGFILKSELFEDHFFDYILIQNYTEITDEVKKILIKEML